MLGVGVRQRSKDLLAPLLEDSEAAVGLGQTWRGSRGRNPVPDLERGLVTATTAAADFNNSSEDNAPKEVFTAGEVSKARAAPSNLNPQSEFLVTGGEIAIHFASSESTDMVKFMALGFNLLEIHPSFLFMTSIL